MKTIILYYSHSGNTRDLANKKAKKLRLDIEEIIEVKKPHMLVGIFRAMRRKKTAIRPIKADLDSYEKIIIMSPVWAAHPVSAINSAIDCLPPGKQVEIIMISSTTGTKDTAEGTKGLIKARGCEVVSYTDLRTKRTEGAVASEVIP